MIAAPFPTAVTMPVVLSTVATAGLDERHTNATPPTGLPFASRALAVNCRVRPSVTSVSVPGVTLTDVGTGGPAGFSLPPQEYPNAPAARKTAMRTRVIGLPLFPSGLDVRHKRQVVAAVADRERLPATGEGVDHERGA